jgi:hypothetical protein
MRRFVAIVLLAASIAGAATASASAPPRGLTSYGRLTWNLDALVRDFYGGARTCFRVRTFSIHSCQQPSYNDGLYQATFAAARRSAFRAVRRSNPLGAINVVGIKIAGRYIACGNGTWLGITNALAGRGEAAACVRP